MQWAEPIYDLIGGKISFYDLLPDTVIGTIKAGNQNHRWNNWADILEPSAGTEIWAMYSNQFYAGKSAVTHHKLGKGSVTYVGPDTDEGALEREVLQRVYRIAGIKTENYPEGVLIDWRDGFWVGVNYSDKPFAVPLSAKAKVLIGDKVLGPADVIVWKD